DAEFVVDLGEVKPVDNVRLGALGFSQVCVALPENVELYGSTDGENYALLATENVPEDMVYVKDATVYDMNFNKLGSKARYLKVKAKNPGNIPAGLPREGAKTWLYFDEISVD
ncbi:MAG: hypothetical protein J1E95_12375, partial [Muribaculaceae bacterium]|nr:hypothetical protein [Muribaculaceae bacterium]